MRYKNKPHILVLIADAWPSKLIAEMLEQGSLPNVQRYFVNEGLYVKKCVSVFPSVSLLSHTAILTGMFPQRYGILGHKWYDRKNSRSYSLLAANSIKINSLLDKSIPTIHEILSKKGYKTISIFEPLSRGSYRRIPAMANSNAVSLKIALDHINKIKDSTCMVVWLPETDSIVHKYGSSSSEVWRSIRRTDKLLGTLFETLRRKGILDNTIIILASDHGHSDVQHHLDIGNLLRNLNLKIGDKFYHRWFQGMISKSLDAWVWTNGHGSGYIHLSGHYESMEKRDSIIQMLRERDVGLIICKEDNNCCSISSQTGEAEFEMMGKYSSLNNAYFSYSFKGRDPLGLSENENTKHLVDGKFHSSEEWLRATIDTDFPDAPVIFFQLCSALTGNDIIVSANQGWDLRDGWRLAWNFGNHLGTHGSAIRDHVLTCAFLRGSNIPNRVVEYGRLIDLLPTLLDALKINIATDGKTLL